MLNSFISFPISDVFRIEKTATESHPIEIDLRKVLSKFWQPGKTYATNDYVRPTDSNGHQYKAQSGGGSGEVEPTEFKKKRNITVGGLVTDGGVTWITEAADANSRDSIVSINTVVPAGITMPAPAFSGMKSTMTISGGTRGRTYTISVEFTLTAGGVKEQKIEVYIRHE